ncbi:MAG: hypothetical protein KatS3mg068_0960 [Candidatus Sericytochromatia bacterium]|nr:MAG: hypothetical protein KatS3mg068_0960 [Candidatus Sericytochromatia bacterium]
MCYDINILSLYIDDELDFESRADVDKHIESCSYCKNKLNFLIITSRSLKNNVFNNIIDENYINNILQNIHPTFEQISAYSDNEISISAYESIDKHINSCNSCNNILKNIKIISKSINTLSFENDIFIQNVLDNLDCLSLEDISAYADNEETTINYSKIENHLKHCEICNNKYNLIKLQSNTISKLSNHVLEIDFADKVLDKINENKIIDISKYFKSYAHRVAMIVGIVFSGIILTMSNPIFNNKIQISFNSEDLLFSNKIDSLTILSDNNINDDILIQDIGL